MVSLLHRIIPYWFYADRVSVIRVKNAGANLARFFRGGTPNLYAFLFKIDA